MLLIKVEMSSDCIDPISFEVTSNILSHDIIAKSLLVYFFVLGHDCSFDLSRCIGLQLSLRRFKLHQSLAIIFTDLLRSYKTGWIISRSSFFTCRSKFAAFWGVVNQKSTRLHGLACKKRIDYDFFDFFSLCVGQHTSELAEISHELKSWICNTLWFDFDWTLNSSWYFWRQSQADCLSLACIDCQFFIGKTEFRWLIYHQRNKLNLGRVISFVCYVPDSLGDGTNLYEPKIDKRLKLEFANVWIDIQRNLNFCILSDNNDAISYLLIFLTIKNNCQLHI